MALLAMRERVEDVLENADILDIEPERSGDPAATPICVKSGRAS